MSFPYALPFFSALLGADPPTSPTGGSTDGSLAAIADPCADAFSRLLRQYEGSPKLRALICSYLHVVQAQERGAAQVYAGLLDLDKAQGAQLDLIGRIAREARNGRSDAYYQRALRVRILINRSQGRLEDLIGVLRLFEPSATTIRIRELPPARMEIRVIGEVTNSPHEINLRARQAKAAGVALTLIVQAGPGALTGRGFRLSRAAAYPEKNTTEGLSSLVHGGGGYLAQGIG